MIPLLFVLLAQQPIAIDTVAVRQLAGFWQRQPGDSIACLYGSRENGVVGRGNGVVVIDSAPRLATMCAGPGIIGAFGFIRPDATTEEAVVMAMAGVLAKRTDWLLAGEVYAVVPCHYPDGGWGKCPLTWGAVRTQ